MIQVRLLKERTRLNVQPNQHVCMPVCVPRHACVHAGLCAAACMCACRFVPLGHETFGRAGPAAFALRNEIAEFAASSGVVS